MSPSERNDAPNDDAATAPPIGATPAVVGVSHVGAGHLDPRRFQVFGLTWLSYASYYFTRKNYALAKVSLQQAYGLTTDQLGTIDSAYSAAYAVGQFFWGWAADRLGPRRVLGIGMIGTALCSVAFGLSTSFWALLVFWTLNGLLQATGWSPNVKAMTGWFADLDRGRVMGMWTTNYTVGSFVANPLGGVFMDNIGWQWAFFGPAMPVAFVGLMLLFFLPELDRARGGTHSKDGAAEDPGAALARRAARTLVLKSPFLWALGVAYFFLKLTRYFFWNWAPYYMETVLHYNKSDARWVPLAFEVGGVIGATTIGWISDKYLRGRRMPAAVVCTLLLGVVLWSYGGVAASGMGANIAILLLFGFLLFGPDAIVSATAAQDIGGPASAAIAAGVINGLGSIGQIVSGKIAPKASAINDWSSVFRMLGIFTGISALILLPFWNRGRRPGK